VWQRHWGLAGDPFDGIESPYVPLPSHDEALSRLTYAIERAEPRVLFRAEAGLGKSTVLRRAIAETRSPGRRFAVIHSPGDRSRLIGGLAQRLGESARRSANWEVLARAIRVAGLDGFHVVLAIDGWDERRDRADVPELDALSHLGWGTEAPPTIIRVARASGSQADPADSWTLAISLRRLTRSQVEVYLQAKLAARGCASSIFTPRALTRLQALSGGVPRGVEQLARLCLIAAAVRGLEVIPPDLVDGVARELTGAIAGPG
jgi:hypothetical protein